LKVSTLTAFRIQWNEKKGQQERRRCRRKEKKLENAKYWQLLYIDPTWDYMGGAIKKGSKVVMWKND